MTPYCTTCGSHDFQHALSDMAGVVGEILFAELRGLDVKTFTGVRRWRDALLIALINFPWRADELLTAWLPQLSANVDFSDVVLYEIARRMPEGSNSRSKWIAGCLSLAASSNSFSLIESLVIVIGPKSLEHPELMELAKQHANNSTQMQRVLRNICKIEVQI